MNEQGATKSSHAEREEKILAFWKEKDIFNKSLAKASPQGEFVFYEGPPTANGRPGIHHLEARAFKDAIPRYKTMRGFHVRRKGGWDTHGLPVELQVEKELGLKSKKEIETYGIEAFNEKCKESVWTYVHEWEDFTNRMGYWVDLKDPYITYKPEYMESVWNVIKTADKKGLLYKDYKVVPWCPRCGTALSSHELAQGYEDVKDLSVYAKFKVKPGQKIGNTVTDDKTFILAWTTTPWTLPGNVGLAVNPKIEYVRVLVTPVKTGVQGSDTETSTSYILAKVRLSALKENKYEIVKTIKGSDLIGLSYEPLYPFLKDAVGPTSRRSDLTNAFKVYPAHFVTTEGGTGIVHIAPMYGQDDFELGNKVGLPKFHLVNEDGTFKKEAGFLAGKFVKDEATDVEIIKDLAHRGLLFHKEKYEHSYPHCWRCHTPLIYFARDSWYIRMSELRHKLVKENERINWEPDYIKEGRFGEWLREVKDWAISRERYWGTPLPIWVCEKCGKKKVIGSVEELKQKPRNTYYVMRHGEAENNVRGTWSIFPNNLDHLTAKGKEQVGNGAQALKGVKINKVFFSPLVRTTETAEIAAKALGISKDIMSAEDRLREWNTGDWNGRPIDDFMRDFPHTTIRFDKRPGGGETYADLKKRMGDYLYELESKYEEQTILLVTHEAPAFMLISAARGYDRRQCIEYRGENDIMKNAEVVKLDFSILPHNHEYELDLHKPYIDEVKLSCPCGGEMKRVKEVMDVWFDSGAMPFAQDHYPFEEGKKEKRKDGKIFPSYIFASLLGHRQKLSYPADFISEAIDQTRGWFYTLHAIGTIMEHGKAFKNVICLGHVLDVEGKKMSKSIGNVVDPWSMMDKHGADALRFWMYSINQPGESKNFDEKTVDEVIKKVFNPAANVAAFYKMYENKAKGKSEKAKVESQNVLDRWIIARLNQLIDNVTINLDKYVLLEPTRAIRDFIADLSQWYLRRSRDRFKEDGSDKQAVLVTTKYVLLTLAKIMAPFTPFFAEELYQNVGGDKESVHLEEWPEISQKSKVKSQKIIKDMETVRSVASKGLEARMVAKINVRQPLSALKVKLENANDLNQDLIELIKDEVNIKEVVFDASIETDFSLDTNLTPELKEKGDLRGLLRKIQDLRKEKGLSIGDKASLIVPNDFKMLTEKYGDEIKKATGLVSIEIGDGLKLN